MTHTISPITPLSYTYNIAALVNAYESAERIYTQAAASAPEKSAEHSMNMCFAQSVQKDLAILKGLQNLDQTTLTLASELPQLPTYNGPQPSNSIRKPLHQIYCCKIA